MNTRKTVIQKITAMLLAFVITMANFAVVGGEVVAYAAEVVATNNKNVEITAYFENAEGEKVTTIDGEMGNQDLKLKVDVTVKNEDGLGGYFEGKIELQEANFKIKDGNEISIHVNAGNTETIEKEIEYQETGSLTPEYLSQTSKVVVSGTYKNSKKDYEIKGETEVGVNWKTPEGAQANLTAEVLTNKEYQIEEESKQVVQILVGSKINNNEYPVKNTEIKVEVPEGVEEVKVHKRTTTATNGDKEISEDDYSVENGILTINLKNEGEEISWAKNSEDLIVVTYKYPAETKLETIKAESKITTYDGKELTAEADAKVEEEKDGIVTAEIEQEEKEIYKGKLYTGEERTYNSTTKINIDNVELTDKIEVEEKTAKYITSESEEEANISYVKTEVNKDEFLKIFGEDGYITIKDQDGNAIANITNSSDANDSGNVVVSYKDGVTSIKVETSKPITEGILNLYHEKKIEKTDYTRTEIESLTGITETVETRGQTAENTITLKETESKASLNLETTSLSTTEENQELKLRVTLETNNESKDLYKNPTVKITLPEQLEVTSAKYKMLYGNGLEKSEATVTKENGQNVITIKLTGEQNSYGGEAVNGTIIDIMANVNVDSLATNSTEKVVLEYTNENARTYANNAQESKNIEIVAENTMILTNDAQTAGVKTQGSEETKQINLEIGEEATEETIDMQIINNEGTELTDISILGTLPTSKDSIILTSAVNSNVSAQVYYTDVENPTIDVNEESNNWTTELNENATSYLVTISSLEKAKGIELSYDLSLEENLDYNLEEEANYIVTYTNTSTGIEESVKSSTLVLTTGASAEINTNLTATVGEDVLQDGAEVRSGEIIKYELTVTNSGKEDATGINITGKVPNGTVLVEEDENYWNSESSEDEESTGNEIILDDEGDENEFIETSSAIEEISGNTSEENASEENYYVEKDSTEKKEENITIKAGATKTFTYMVKVKSDIEDNTETTAEMVVQYGEETYSETIMHKLRTATLSATLVAANRTGNDKISTGFVYQYELEIKNISNSEQKNIEVTINNNDLITINSVTKVIDDEYTDLGEVQTFTIDKLSAGQIAYIEINGLINQPTDDLNKTQISVTTKDSKNNSYRSNVISETVVGTDVNVELTSETTSKNKTGYVYAGDTITYTITVKNTGKTDADNLIIKDMISDYVSIEKTTLNGKEVEYNTVNVFETEDNSKYSVIEISSPLKAGETAKVVVTTKVEDFKPTETLKIINKASVYNNANIAETEEEVYYLETATSANQGGNNSNSGTDNSNNSGSSNGTAMYSISGTVWVDENGDGAKDSKESVLEGITVYAIDVLSNEVKETTTTNKEGLYTLSNLSKGNYIVAFEYDNLKYLVTAYQAEGVSENKNSDAVKTSMLIEGESKEIAATDSINLSSSVANIDLGLIENKVFDLDIDKFVSKIVVTNSTGTKTYEQEDETTLAKVEIGSKVLSGSNVVVEYTIRVTNNGEIAGYAKSIVDYLPSALSFSSSLNSDWYQSGKYIYNSSLANTKIEPGETKEVKLILTKTMTNSNTGLINNKAEIEDSYNTLGIAESDKEDTGSADIIIGVKTGAAVSYVILTFTIIIIICGVAYLVNKKILESKIKI